VELPRQFGQVDDAAARTRQQQKRRTGRRAA